ncbi:hypothetical protein FHR81_000309 [Actinoalloteichus hoggarensis]|uniref:DUF5753 domain-containing protein n=1 Tax=Actinoalloteichus hoggarensis TaxID=1470176 RepID=A0A221W2F6_9PSEU|nr:hypothetical protein AHOG_11835 [Actinoalloteichus hoggarensis]MBB5919280.1 hypothetical protein [Actinoalloteichus hoggarensis]
MPGARTMRPGGRYGRTSCPLDWLKTFVGLEGPAEREFVFEPLIAPGLLQTEAYAETVTTDTPRVRADHGERFVGLRTARAPRLSEGERLLHLHAVTGEAAPRLKVGTPEVRRDQLRHLVRTADLPNVTTQGLRPEDGPHTATTGQFVILDFEEARSIAYAELHDGSVHVQDPDQVHSSNLVAENPRHVALGPTPSSALIRSMIEVEYVRRSAPCTHRLDTAAAGGSPLGARTTAPASNRPAQPTPMPSATARHLVAESHA